MATRTERQPVLPEKPLGRGRTADIYAWGEGRVLKLFHDWFSLEAIQDEARIAQAVSAGGLPAPRPGEIVQVDGRNGLVYERIEGQSMLPAFRQTPWRLFDYARQMAALHARMHAASLAIDLPTQRQRIERSIRNVQVLPPGLQAACLAALEGLPGGERVCHGDLHPDNILLTPRGGIVIDWMAASLGNPLGDVARSSIILLGVAGSDQEPNPINKIFIRLFHAEYLRHYFHLRPGGEAEYRRWLPVVAAARLNEGIPEVESWLVEQAGKV